VIIDAKYERDAPSSGQSAEQSRPSSLSVLGSSEERVTGIPLSWPKTRPQATNSLERLTPHIHRTCNKGSPFQGN
jgi:hypothetical protein